MIALTSVKMKEMASAAKVKSITHFLASLLMKIMYWIISIVIIQAIHEPSKGRIPKANANPIGIAGTLCFRTAGK